MMFMSTVSQFWKKTSQHHWEERNLSTIHIQVQITKILLLSSLMSIWNFWEEFLMNKFWVATLSKQNLCIETMCVV